MHSWCVDSRIAVSLSPWVDLGKYIECNIQLTDGICVSVQFTDMINHKYDKYECVYTDAQNVRRQKLCLKCSISGLLMRVALLMPANVSWKLLSVMQR